MLKQPRVFKSLQMVDLTETVRRIAPCDAPVLIVGETGVGKEVIAELIHEQSLRHSKDMVRINCAAIPRELIESELFGSIRGSYTGSISERTGLFMAANGGTIFLDELSEMPVELQTRLLRIVQYQKVRAVGAVHEQGVNVRIIATLNAHPEKLIKEHRLRDDLYYRLCTISLKVPPLRQRAEDVVPLCDAYLDYYARLLNRTAPLDLHPQTEQVLTAYAWPGNVRQLQNEMNRLTVLCTEPIVRPDHLMAEITVNRDELTPNNFDENDSTESLSYMDSVKRVAIINALKACNGNKLMAAKKLGIGRQTLYNLMKKLQLGDRPTGTSPPSCA